MISKADALMIAAIRPRDRPISMKDNEAVKYRVAGKDSAKITTPIQARKRARFC